MIIWGSLIAYESVYSQENLLRLSESRIHHPIPPVKNKFTPDLLSHDNTPIQPLKLKTKP
jgi:hypothetical protein